MMDVHLTGRCGGTLRGCPSKPRRSPGPQDRQRDPERTRALILDAATAEFGAHGFAGARVAAIAARAGVAQQLISYYFDSKEGLYRALSERWRERNEELAPPGTPLDEQVRRFALEALADPDSVRLFAWSGLEYGGPDTDTDLDHGPRARRLQAGVDRIRAARDAGRLPPDVDPACLMVMLMAAAMATTTLPHVIEGLCGESPRSEAFVHHFAEQAATLVHVIGLASA